MGQKLNHASISRKIVSNCLSQVSKSKITLILVKHISKYSYKTRDPEKEKILTPVQILNDL